MMHLANDEESDSEDAEMEVVHEFDDHYNAKMDKSELKNIS